MSRIAARPALRSAAERAHQQHQAARRRRRLFLECLEQRSLLATLTWDGSSSGNWNDAANWVGDIAPAGGDDLVFPGGAGNLTNNNNYPAGTTFNTVLFTGGGYNVTGNAINLTGSITANNTAGNNAFAPALTLANAATMTAANPGTTLTLGAINTQNLEGLSNIFGTSALFFDGAGTVVVAGVISGQGGIYKLGTGTAVLQGANTYQGVTDVRQGFIRVENSSGLGSALSGDTQVQAGAQLQLAGNLTIAEAIAVREAGVGFGNGTDPGTLGALRALSGAINWTGNMDLAGGNNLIGADTGASLNISGVIASATSGTNRLIKVGGGTLRLSGTQANVFRGETIVLQGTLELGKTAGMNAIGGNLVIGDNIGGDNAATLRLLASNQIPHVDFFGVNLTQITMNASGSMDFNSFSDTVGNLILNQGASYAPDIDLNGGTLTLGGASLTVNNTGVSATFQGTSGLSPSATIADGNFDLGTFFSGVNGGQVKTFAINDTQLNNVAADLTISANITGAVEVGLSKTGGGTLVLSGTSTYAGPTALTAGIVGVGSNSAFGAGHLSLQGSSLRAFGADRTVPNSFSIDATVPMFGDLDLTFTGAGTLTATRTIQVMDPAGVLTFAGPVGEGIFNNQGVTKAGRGTLQFTAANTFSGTVTINSDGGTLALAGNGSLLNVPGAITVGQNGVLRLDNQTTNNSDRISNLTNITLNGGELLLVGNPTAPTAETTGVITVGDQLASTISVQNTSSGAQSVVLVGNSLTSGNTRTVNFRAIGGDLSATGPNRIVFQNAPGNLATATPPNAGTALNTGVIFSSRTTGAAGTNLATYGSAPEGIAILPLPATGYTSDLANAGPLSNVRITTPGTYTLTSSKTINSLMIGPGVTITGADVVLTVTAGIFDFIGSGTSALNVESINLGGGSVFVDAGMNATIGGNIIAATSLNKGGSGRLILSGDNTYSGTLNVNEGVVTLQRSTAAGSVAAGILVRQGGTLELQQTTFGPINMGLEAITLTGVGQSATGQYADAVGALRNVAGNNSWAGRLSLAGDPTDLTGATLLNGFPVIANSTTFVNVESGTQLTVTGDVVNAIEVIKRGPGTLQYAGVLANTNDNATRILDGTLELNKDRGINAVINTVFVGSDRPGAPAATLRLLNSDQIRDDRGTFVHSSGLLDIGQTEGFGTTLTMVVASNGAADVTIGAAGTFTTNVDLTVMTAGIGNPTGATITGGTVQLTFPGIQGATAARTWQVNDGATGTDLTINSAIVDGTGLQSFGITKSGFGTLEFAGNTPNTYTGTTLISEGTLVLNKGTGGAGGVNALAGPVAIGDSNPTSGFANSDVLRLLQPNQIPDQLAAVDVRNTGLFDLNNKNETIGNVDVQAALTVNGGATVSTGTGILTVNGDITANLAQGATIFTPVAPGTINGRLNFGGTVPRSISIPDRSELAAELIINADVGGTAGFVLTTPVNTTAGTTLFSGNSTLSGNIFRNAGNLAVGSDTALGTATVFLNGGSFLTYNGPRTLANPFVVNAAPGGNAATLSLLSSNGLANSAIVGGGGNNLTFTGPFNVLSQNANTFLLSTPAAGLLEFAGSMGESTERITLRKQGPGTLILSSPVTLSNGLEVGEDPGGNARTYGGVVVLRGQGTLLNGNITIGHGGVFQIDNSVGNLTNRLGDTTQIDLFGGTLALVSGSGGQAAESMGLLRGRNAYTGTVQVLTSPVAGSNATWRFTSFGLEGTNQGTSVKFVGRGQNITNTGTSRVAFNVLPGGATALQDGILPQSVLQGSGGFDFATVVNTVGAAAPFDNFLTALTSGPNFATTLAGATNTTNVRLTASEAVAGPITANAILLAGSGIVISGAGPLTVDGSLIASVGAGNQISVAALNAGTNEGIIYVNEGGDLDISSAIGGAALALSKNGRGSLTLSNNANPNTFAGIFRPTDGVVRVTKDSAFGGTTNGVTVTWGSTLELAGGITIPAELLTIVGQGEGARGAIPLRNVSGVNTWLGNVTMNTNRTGIDVAAGSLTIGDAANPGLVASNGFSKYGPGTLQFAGNASNTFTATSIIWDGTLELNKVGGANAIPVMGDNAELFVGSYAGANDSAVLRNLGNEQLGDGPYRLRIMPSGVYNVNGFTETIIGRVGAGNNHDVLGLEVGSLGSGDVNIGAGGILRLGNNVAENGRIQQRVFSGGFPTAATIAGGTLELTGTGGGANGPRRILLDDSAAVEELLISSTIADGAGGATGLIKNLNNNGRLVLAPSAAGGNTFTMPVTLDSSETVVRGVNPLGTGTVNINSGFTLLVDGATLGNTISLLGVGFGGQGAVRNVAGNNTLSGLITMTAATTLGVDAGSSLNLSNTVSEGAAGLGLTKLLPGNLILSGTTANTYTGTTTVSEGTLTLNKTAGVNAFGGALTVGNDTGGVGNFDVVQLNAANQIPDTVAVTVQSSGRLNLGANNETVGSLTVATAMTNSAQVSSTGAGTLSLNGNITANVVGTFTPRSPGSVISGNLNLNDGNRTITVNDNGLNIMELVIDAAISSGGTNGAITSSGAGLLVLTNNNTAFTGGTTVNAGAGLVVRNNGALGTGALTYTAASGLYASNYGAPLTTVTIPNTINLGADLTIRGDNNLVLSGTINGLTGANRTLNINLNAAANFTVSGTINLSNDATARTFIIAENTFNHSSTISGVFRNGSGATNHALQKTGVGTLVLSGDSKTAPNNDFIGLTTISNGIVRLANNNALGNTVSEVQQFGISGVVGGSFTVTYGGFTTAAINFDGAGNAPSAATLEAALNLLPSLTRTNGLVTVTSSSPNQPSTTYQITFGGALAGVDLNQIAAVTPNAQASVSPAISTITNGSGHTVVNGGSLTANTGLSVLEPIFLTGNGFGNQGTLRLMDLNPAATETLTWPGVVRFDNTAWVGVDAGGATPDRLIITGYAMSNTGVTSKVGYGELEFGGTSDNGLTVFATNVPGLDDGLDIRSGTVFFNKPANLQAIIGTVALNVGDGGGTDRLVIMGASNDHIGGTVPLNISPSGIVTMTGAATGETLPNTLTLQRWSNAAGSLDTGAVSITLSNTVNVTNIGFSDGTTPAAQISGAVNLNAANRSFSIADSLILNAAEDAVVSAVLSGAAGSAVQKDNYGTLALTGANTYPGTTTVNAGTAFDGLLSLVGGTLVARNAGVLGTGALVLNEGTTVTLNNTAADVNRVADAAAVTLNGRLNLIGNAAGSTEVVGAITANVVNNGGPTPKITINSSAGGVTELRPASLARGGGATVEFEGVGADLGLATNSRIQIVGGTSPYVNNVLPWGTLRGPAGYDLVTDPDGSAAAAPYYVGRVTTYNTSINSGGIVRLTGGAHTLLAASTPIDALLIEGGATVTGANNELVVGTATAGLIVSAGGNNSINLGATGKITYGGREVLLLSEGGSSLTIGAAINGTGLLRKERDGIVTLAGDSDQGATSQFTGTITVNQGTLRATNAKSLGAAASTGNVTVNNFGTLSLEANMALAARALSIAGQGVGNNGALVVTSGNTVTWTNAAATITYNSNPLIVNTAGNLIFDSVVTGGATLLKIGAGTLEYRGTLANTTTGGVSVNEGTLLLNKTGAVNAIPNAITVTVEDLGNFDPAGSAVLALGTLGTNQIIDTTNVTLNDQGQFLLNNASETIATLTVNGSRIGSDNVATGTGTLTLTTNLTLSGGTTNGKIVFSAAAGGGTLTYNTNSFGPTGQAVVAAALDLGGQTRTFAINDNYAVNDVIFSGAITNGRIIKSGAGAIALTNTGNTFLAGVNEIQSITVPVAVTSFTLTFNGVVTPSVSTFDIPTIQAALNTVLGAGNSLVTNPSAGVFNIEFTGNLAGVDVSQFTSTAVGGTITHATVTAGAAGFNLSAGGLALPSSAPLGTATLNVSNTAVIRPIAGAALTLSIPIIVSPVNNQVTTFGGRRDFGGTDAVTVSGGIMLVPSVAVTSNFQIDDPLVAATISGVISGGALNVSNASSAFTKSGFGKLILSGNNTFVGNTTVAAGIVNVRNSNAFGAATGSLNGNFVSVAGLAALELEGGLTITDRSLILGFANPPAQTVVGGYQNNFTGALRSLSGSNVWNGPVELRGDGTVRSFVIGVDAGDLTIDGSIAATNGTALFAHNLLKTGPAPLIFAGNAPNLYTGFTGVLSGMLALAKTPGANAIAGTLIVGDNLGTNDTVEIRSTEQVINTAAVQVQSSGKLVLTNTVTNVAAPNEIQTIAFGSIPTAGTWVLMLPGQTINNIPFNVTPAALERLITAAYGAPTVRVGGVTGVLYSLTFIGSQAGTDLGAVGVTASGLTPIPAVTVTEVQNGGGANSILAGETINTPLLVVGETSSALVDIGTATLTFNGDVTVSPRPGINTALAAQITGTGTAKVALLPITNTPGTRTFTINDGSGLVELSIVPPIHDRTVIGTAVAASINKAGAGRLNLAGANLFSGTVTVTTGVLRVQNADGLGDSPPPSTVATVTVNAGAALEFDMTGTNTIDNELITLNGSGIINGPATPFFTVAQGTGALRNIAGTNTIFAPSASNIVTLGSTTLVTADAGRLIFNGTLNAGNQTLLKAGTGEVELGGDADNIFNGNLIVNEGKLILNKSGAARAHGINVATIGGDVYIGDNLGGDNSDVIEIGPQTGGDQIENNRPMHIARTGRLDLNNFTEAVSGTIVLDVGPTMSADIVTGTGTFAQTALVNTIIAINQAGLTPTSPAATLQGNYDGAALARNFEARQGPANVEFDIQAVIGNATGITKNGRGTIAISGNNTFTGTTTVNVDSGTLVVNTPATVAASNYTVREGSTLGGTGTINGTVTLSNVASSLMVGGSINPGVPGPSPGNTGILTVANNVTFGTRAELYVDLNGTTPGTGHDQLRVTGTGTITINTTVNNGSNLTGATGLAIAVGTGMKVIDKVSTGAITGTFMNAVPPSPPATVVIGTRNYTFDYVNNSGLPLGDGNDFVLTAIPSTVVWDGRVDGGAVTASNDWTFAANWVGDAVPAAGDAILFNDIGIGNGKNLPFNDFPAGTQFGLITFANASGSYTVTGNAISLGHPSGISLVSDNATNVAVTNALNVPVITANTAQTIIVKDGSTLAVGATTIVAAAPLTVNNGTGVDASGSITFSGTVDGAAPLTIDIVGDATFSGAVGGVTALTSVTIANADDVTFSSTVATTGNLSQSTGTGTTTISGGTIAGTLNITNRGAALAGVTTTVAGNTTLNSTLNGVTQTAGALITPSLTLTGAGAFSLPQAANDFNSVQANVTGAVTLRDTDDLAIAGTGIVATGNVALITGGPTTQTAAIVAAALELGGAGPFTLLLPANDVATVAASATGVIRYADANGFVVGTVNTTVGITSTANVTLGSGGAVTQTAPIVGTGLELLGAGPFTLTSATNDVATLAANTTGAISYADANTLTIGTVNSVGVTTDNDNVTLSTGGALTLTAAIAAPTAIVTLAPTGSIVDGNAAANNVTAGQLAATALSGIGTVVDPIETTVGAVEANGGTGGVFLVNTGNLIVGGVSGALTGVAATANISLSSTGNITVNEPISTTGNVSLSSTAGGISNTGAAVDVVAQDLTASAVLGIDLDTTITNLTLTNTGAGNVQIDETDGLVVISLNVANGAATINAGGPLTNAAGSALSVSGNASFGGSTVTLGTQAGDNLTFGGFGFNSPGAVIVELNSATSLAGTSTAATLSLISTGAVNSSAGANVNVSGAAVFTAPSLNLGNQAGDTFNFGTINVTSPGAVSIAEDSNMQLVGANTAASLTVFSAGALTNAPGATITVTGLANFGGASVDIGNQAGDTVNAGLLGFAGTGPVNITEDSSTQLGGTSTAGSLILTSPGAITSAAAANVTVTGATSLTGTSITIGNQAGDNFNLGPITFTATTGTVTIEENASLDLAGTSTAPGAIVLTSVDAVAAGQDLVLPAGAAIASATAAVTLNAGDNATIGGNVTSALTTTINVDFGDAESPGGELVPGTGGQVIITGVITTASVATGGGAFLNGGNDFDTFTFSPQTTTEFRVNGGAPTGTATGDTLQLDTSVTTNPLLIAPGTIAPYNGPGSGSWTFSSPHQQVLFTNIEDNSPPTPFHLTIDNSTTPIGNIVIMRDSTQTRVQIRDGSNAGPIIFQGLLTSVLSVRVLGSSGNDIVTVDDINTLPDFLLSVPGVNDNPNLPGAGEILFDGLGGSDTFVFALNGPSVNQTYALGTGSGPGIQEGEIQSVGSAISLTSYFRNVELVQRTGTNVVRGTSTVAGDASNNDMSITANGALTRASAPGFVPYDVANSSVSQLILNGLAGDDNLAIVSVGSGPAAGFGVALNGGADTDTLRLFGTSGQPVTATLLGGLGSDTMQLFSATNTVDGYSGPVVVDGTDGNVGGNDDKLVIVDTGDATFDNVVIGAVNAGTTADYRVEGINSTVGDDVVFRNIDTLNYTGTQGNDRIDAQFVNTSPQHDLTTAVINGWLGADQFLLFTSDQAGGIAPTPSGVPSGLATINLNGDAPGNPNALDGNDAFGETAPGLVGTGGGNAGLIVADSVRGIRPSVTTAIVINGGQPTGPAAPTGDVVGDVLNLDLSALPSDAPLILATVSGIVSTTGLSPLTYAQIEDFNLILNNQLVNVQMGDMLVRGTSDANLIQFMRNPQPGDPEHTRIRLDTDVEDFTTSGKTLVFAGAGPDYVTMSNVNFPGEIYGEAGDDYIAGAGASDLLVGGLDNDQINAGTGDNIIWGDNAPGSADPQPQDSSVGGDDVLSALAGNDVFYGGGGKDTVSAGAGDDYIYGGQGNDTLGGHIGNDRMYGGPGNDIIDGAAGDDLLVGGGGSDQLMGRDGNDILVGGAASDALDGGNGYDLLITGILANEASSWTSAPIATTFSPNLYSRPSDNDAALMLLLAQWAAAANRSTLAAVVSDGVPDSVVTGGAGSDDTTFGNT